MNRSDKALVEALRTCKQHGIPPTRHLLVVEISRQTVCLYERTLWTSFGMVRRYRCSTSKFGISQIENSQCTPLGLHRVAEKIGGGWPVGAVFKGRRFVGYTWQELPYATITNRIFWLEGLEPGFNRGGNVDSHARYIYIHGTGYEPSIGRPASHGCIHLAAQDLIPLHDWLPSGTLVWITK